MENQRTLEPTDKKDALEILAHAIGKTNGLETRTFWKAFETIENLIIRQEKEVIELKKACEK